MPVDRCPAPACGATDGEREGCACVRLDGHRVGEHECRCGHRWTDGGDRLADALTAANEREGEVTEGVEYVCTVLAEALGLPDGGAIDGDGTEWSIIADHIRVLAAERDRYRAGFALARQGLIEIEGDSDDLNPSSFARDLLAALDGVAKAAELEADLAKVNEVLASSGETADEFRARVEEMAPRPGSTCLAHLLPEPCGRCAAYIAAGL